MSNTDRELSRLHRDISRQNRALDMTKSRFVPDHAVESRNDLVSATIPYPQRTPLCHADEGGIPLATKNPHAWLLSADR
jgi:hypothetical protein